MIKIKYAYKALIFFTLFILTGCTLSSIKNKDQSKIVYEKLDQKIAKENLDISENIILVDVRTPQEYKEVHIPGSILLPDYELKTLAPDNLPDKDALIYVYCRSGRRSQESVNLLIDMGYTRVYDIGGIIDWEYETVSE